MCITNMLEIKPDVIISFFSTLAATWAAILTFGGIIIRDRANECHKSAEENFRYIRGKIFYDLRKRRDALKISERGSYIGGEDFWHYEDIDGTFLPISNSLADMENYFKNHFEEKNVKKQYEDLKILCVGKLLIKYKDSFLKNLDQYRRYNQLMKYLLIRGGAIVLISLISIVVFGSIVNNTIAFFIMAIILLALSVILFFNICKSFSRNNS